MNHYTEGVFQNDCPAERRLSALLFGNRHKLELLGALAAAEDGRVNLSLLAARQEVPASVYYGPIKDLITAGLAERLLLTDGDRRRWYARIDHELWECVRNLVGHVSSLEVTAS